MNTRFGITVERDNAPILPDAVLDELALVFAANPWIRARGILFDTFVRAPREILDHGMDLPLVAQVAVRDRIEAADRDLERLTRGVEVLLAGRRTHVSGGRIVETVPHKHQHRRPSFRDHRPWRLGGGA